MLKVQNITFSYDESNVLTFPDFQLNKGEKTLILGRSGAGKTTLILLLAGLLKPCSGLLEHNGIPINSLSTQQLDKFRGKNIGMIFQSPKFVKNISILENLLLSQYLSINKQDKKRATKTLCSLGLENKVNCFPSQLSQGEQQRAAIALATVKKPSLILADEPTSSLDDENCRKTSKLLIEQANETKAKLIIITHDHRLKSQFKKHISL